MIEDSYTPIDKSLIVDLHGKRMRLPSDDKYWPKIEWIQDRNAKLDWL
jgi:hypothetical protein